MPNISHVDCLAVDDYLEGTIIEDQTFVRLIVEKVMKNMNMIETIEEQNVIWDGRIVIFSSRAQTLKTGLGDYDGLIDSGTVCPTPTCTPKLSNMSAASKNKLYLQKADVIITCNSRRWSIWL